MYSLLMQVLPTDALLDRYFTAFNMTDRDSLRELRLYEVA